MAGKVCSKRKRFETPCVTAWSWLPSPVASRGRGRAPVLALVVLADWLKRAEPGPLTRPAGSDNDLHLPLNSGPHWHRADVRRYVEAFCAATWPLLVGSGWRARAARSGHPRCLEGLLHTETIETPCVTAWPSLEVLVFCCHAAVECQGLHVVEVAFAQPEPAVCLPLDRCARHSRKH